MSRALLEFLRTEANNLEQAGLLRREMVVEAPKGTTFTFNRKELLNLCSTDFLGLGSHPEVKRAAKAAIDTFGVGLAASRAVTGTLGLHVELEKAVAKFLGTEDALVFASAYHAATGVFESLLGEKDYLVCDGQLNAGLADGVKLCRARVFQYRNGDMGELEDRLRRSRSARFRVIITDGVFPLEGTIAPLASICELAEKYEAVVMVDDSQGLGVLGAKGRGCAELFEVGKRVELTVGSFAHALGAGEGGFVAGKKEIVAWLRQKSRPHLTSNALSPAAAAAALQALELAAAQELRDQLNENARIFREGLRAEGFKLIDSLHPTVSVLLGDAVATQRMADLLFRKGIFAMGFCHPVVPEGSARIRAQVTRAHTPKDLTVAASTFGAAARELKVLDVKE